MGIFSRRQRHPQQDIPVQECSFVVFDTELTGLDDRRDSIVSVGAVRMQGCRIDLSRTFNSLVKPDTELSHSSILIHGIIPSEVDEQPRIQTVLSDFSAFCSSDILVGFCVAIDMAFLNRQMRRVAPGPLQNPVVDIYRLYEWLRNRSERKGDAAEKFPILAGEGLYEMARLFAISLSSAHDALMDAFTTAQIFQRLLCRLSDEGVLNSRDLLRIGDPYTDDNLFGRGREANNFQF
jgi:DNA polymerase III subunit epsilon